MLKYTIELQLNLVVSNSWGPWKNESTLVWDSNKVNIRESNIMLSWSLFNFVWSESSGVLYAYFGYMGLRQPGIRHIQFDKSEYKGWQIKKDFAGNGKWVWENREINTSKFDTMRSDCTFISGYVKLYKRQSLRVKMVQCKRAQETMWLIRYFD